MEKSIKDGFLAKWKRYFNGAELPITFYYTDETGRAGMAPRSTGYRCIIADLSQVRGGKPVCFDVDTMGCILRHLIQSPVLIYNSNYPHFNRSMA